LERIDGRSPDEMRPVRIEPNVLKYPEGSAYIEMGDTKVICTATIEEKVPSFLRGTGKGWVTAEYSMIPRATEQRGTREATKGKLSGRTMEIQRLIGRSLRAVVDLQSLGEKTIWLDCDVIQADGGTRTAAISGAFVALMLALDRIFLAENMEKFPGTDFLAAISTGILKDMGPVLDLNYAEDVQATVDLNVVMTGSGRFVEVQGTGEEATFSRDDLFHLLDLARSGIERIIGIQRVALGDVADKIGWAKREEVME
jgi:RNAse PH (EC 2.7.7.56)